MEHTREDILKVVEASPARVAAHDRAGWIALFAEDGVVEDPVGGAPAVGPGALGRFFDTFIAFHDVRFEISQDCVRGLEVMRDVVIHTRVSGIDIDVPAYLLYQLAEADGRLVIRRMAAHWELASLSRAALGKGPRAAWAMTRLFGRMLGTMGPAWVGRYLGALGGVGARGKAALARLSAALQARDGQALTALFASAGPCIDLGARRLAPGELAAAWPAGARLALERELSAGRTTSARYAIEGGPAPSRGVVLLAFAPGRGAHIAEARFFEA